MASIPLSSTVALWNSMGPHLAAESTDTVRAYAEAIDLAERLGNALVAPVIRPGVSLPHMVLPGSISLRPSVFKGIVEDYISSYVHHGFTHVVLASTHGGNMPTLLQVFNESREKYPDIRFRNGLYDGRGWPSHCSLRARRGPSTRYLRQPFL